MTMRTSTTLHTSVPALALLAAIALVCAGCKPAWKPPDMTASQSEAISVNKSLEMVAAAQRLEYAGKKDEAIQKYYEAIREYRNTPQAWNNVGRLLMESGANMEAAEAFKTASEISTNDPRPVYNLGTLWENLLYYDEADEWYDEALKRDPNYLPALRRSILIDGIRRTSDATTAERIKRALILENDPWWIERFQRSRIHAAENMKKLGTAAPDAGGQ